MPIRKQGAATGRITGVEDDRETMTGSDARDERFLDQHTAARGREWDEKDERDLAAENDRTDV